MRNILFSLIALLSVATCQTGHAALPNLALGKPYRLEPAPDYPLCTEAGDSAQLTDGKLVQGLLWTQPGCVGWANHSPVIITIDLQTNQPIAGVSFHTAASSVSGVGWPSSIYLWVSDDEKTWHIAGDLVALSARHSLPPAVSQNPTHRFATMDLNTHGRFVKFIIVPTEAYIFADEIEILRGPDDLLKKPAPGPLAIRVPDYQAATKIDSFVRRRLTSDLSAIRANLDKTALSKTTHLKLATELDAIAMEIPSTRLTNSENFRTTFPLNNVHRRIFTAQAALWRLNGFKGIVAWPAQRWDMLSPTETPSKAAPSLDVAMMGNEFRSAAFNLSNAEEKPTQLSLTIEGLPGGKNPGYLTVHEVPFTDTQSGVPIAAALPVIEQQSGKFSLQLPSGLTRQLWLTFHPKDIPAGDYPGRIVVRKDGWRVAEIPLRLKLYPFTFPDQPTLHLGGWDYTDQETTYEATPANREALIRHLREHFVDTPWAQTMVMPPGKYDPVTGHMTEPPDPGGFRTWVNRWPNARNYFVFSNLGETFAGLPMGTPAFTQAVTEWINWWANQLHTMKIKPQQLGLLIVDEPREPQHDRIVIQYAKVIRAAQPGIVIFEDPIWNGPWRGDKEMFKLSHIICPNLPMCIEHGRKYLNFYLKQRNDGRRLWFYSCHGPGKLLDPYSYHRMQQWFCWKYRAEGAGFWAFGDSNGASSWNEYLTASGAFTPLFLDTKTVTAGKHMEAIREGMEDYEYLRLLRDRVQALEKQGVKNEKFAAARHLLDTAADRVIACMTAVGQIYWGAAKDRSVADQVRVEILEALNSVQD
jgi:hypothetical protein